MAAPHFDEFNDESLHANWTGTGGTVVEGADGKLFIEGTAGGAGYCEQTPALGNDYFDIWAKATDYVRASGGGYLNDSIWHLVMWWNGGYPYSRLELRWDYSENTMMVNFIINDSSDNADSTGVDLGTPTQPSEFYYRLKYESGDSYVRAYYSLSYPFTEGAWTELNQSGMTYHCDPSATFDNLAFVATRFAGSPTTQGSLKVDYFRDYNANPGTTTSSTTTSTTTSTSTTTTTTATASTSSTSTSTSTSSTSTSTSTTTSTTSSTASTTSSTSSTASTTSSTASTTSSTSSTASTTSTSTSTTSSTSSTASTASTTTSSSTTTTSTVTTTSSSTTTTFSTSSTSTSTSTTVSSSTSSSTTVTSTSTSTSTSTTSTTVTLGLLFFDEFDDESINPGWTEKGSGTATETAADVIFLEPDATSSKGIAQYNFTGYFDVYTRIDAVTKPTGSNNSFQGLRLLHIDGTVLCQIDYAWRFTDTSWQIHLYIKDTDSNEETVWVDLNNPNSHWVWLRLKFEAGDEYVRAFYALESPEGGWTEVVPTTFFPAPPEI